MTITRGAIAKYMLLPGLWPRLKALFGNSFAHVAYLTALIYASVRLLPETHPYLNRENFGRFGIRHVIAEAANNLVISKQNIDQIIIFFTILLALILLLGQFVILGIAVFYQPALAQGVPSLIENYSLNQFLSIPSNFTPHGPTNDVVMVMMDRIFGVPDLFNSCISSTAQCTNMYGQALPTPTQYPFPIHTALHALFGYYSLAMMGVGAVMILYFIITIIGETAVTGTPFGQRFNKAWAPVRLIVFFAMIVPLSSPSGEGLGLNLGQYLVLNTAKFGSHFATNGWSWFNIQLQRNNLVSSNQMLAEPTIPELGTLAQFMFVVKACEAALSAEEGPFNAHVIRPGLVGFDGTDINAARAQPIDRFSTYQEVMEFSNMGNITIAFGHYDEEENALHRGHVKPFCGTLQLLITDVVQEAAVDVQEHYFDLIQYMYHDDRLSDAARCFVNRTMNATPRLACDMPTTSDMRTLYNDYRTRIQDDITDAFSRPLNEAQFAGPAGLQELGWGGAAIWYNTIAELNGAATSAVLNIPQPQRYPLLMEETFTAARTMVEVLSEAERYNPRIADDIMVDFDNPQRDFPIAAALYEANKLWEDADGELITTLSHVSTTGNFVVDILNFILGTEQMFAIRKNTDVNPMAQLSSLGKAMVERSVMLLGGAGIGKMVESFTKTGSALSDAGKALGGFGFSVGSISLLLGFMLYFVLPLMPFIYFIFAVSGWVKSIFEAVVAVPMWALAHIRIDGEGLPGQDASSGYYLILEIFLRPFLIVIGLIAGILTFSAMALVLNDIFVLMVDEAKDFNLNQDISELRFELDYLNDAVDTFFYTAIYVIMIYIAGVSCFKLVDLIPQSILRWIGSNVKTFQEEAGDPAGQLAGQVYKRANITMSVLRGDPGETAALASGL